MYINKILIELKILLLHGLNYKYTQLLDPKKAYWC